MASMRAEVCAFANILLHGRVSLSQFLRPKPEALFC